ncbi:MAG: hypothetical protein H7A35_08225 [Planctomycetales bacterium]|nr:hypothetical protein [bacterium]UNM06871.1 MAG: hypothetical protein H7A35_08225 [Planctomycetales bacterium]
MPRICLTLTSRSLALAAVLAMLIPGGCAHDANSGLDIVPYPDEVNIIWSVRGNSFSPDYWYYTVFNFSKAPSISAVDRPIDVISNEDRALNWELYIGFHPETGGTQLFTKQIPRGPTVIGTGDGPTCTTTFDADGNGFGDIVVTCAEDGVTQLIESVAVQDNLLEPIYFRPVRDINDGVRPFRCHNYDFDADGNRDVVVLDAGNAGTAPFIRVLQGNGNAEFTALADQPLGIEVLVDSIMQEFNNDTISDIALIGESGGVRSVQVLLGNADGTFTATDSITVADRAISLQHGILEQGTDSLAIAESGTGAADGMVRVLDVADDGTISLRSTLDVPGECFSASIGNGYLSREAVLACWQNADGTGSAGAWLTDSAGTLAATPVAFSTGNNVPTYCLADETGNDNSSDIILVTGDPDNLDQTLYIQRSGRETPEGGGDSVFTWEGDIITYLTGLQPTRIEVAPVDNLSRDELIVPHSSLEDGGNSISIFYGLGKSNYTTAERYWTDTLPDILSNTYAWYVGSQFTQNAISLTIDPNVFYDLAEQRPEDFTVQFFTCDAGINLLDNEDQLGEVRDQLLNPIAVQMEVDFYTDEQINPQANTDVFSVAEADIDNYQITVN